MLPGPRHRGLTTMRTLWLLLLLLLDIPCGHKSALVEVSVYVRSNGPVLSTTCLSRLRCRTWCCRLLKVYHSLATISRTRSICTECVRSISVGIKRPGMKFQCVCLPADTFLGILLWALVVSCHSTMLLCASVTKQWRDI